MMLEWIDKHKIYTTIIFIAIAAVMPIIVNALSTIDSSCEILNEPSPWLIFWGSYIAGIASLGMIVITAYSIFRNNEEVKLNRDLQINSIAYQTQIQWINTLKIAIQQVYEAFNILWLNEIYVIIKNTTDNNNAENYSLVKNKLEELRIHMNRVMDSFKLTVIGKIDTNEQEHISQVESVMERYCDLINDLLVLSSVCFHNGTDDMLRSHFNKVLGEYKSNLTSTNDTSHRIWSVAEKYSNELKGKRAAIAYDLINKIQYSSLYNACELLLKHEIDKANKILNGTEQDK